MEEIMWHAISTSLLVNTAGTTEKFSLTEEMWISHRVLPS